MTLNLPIGRMSAPTISSIAALRRRFGGSAMVLVTLVYASLMLLSIGGSALAASGHRASEVLHVREDVTQHTIPPEQQYPQLEEARQKDGASSARLTTLPSDSPSLHAVPTVSVPLAAFAAWVTLVTREPVFNGARPVEWPVHGAILALLQRHHRAVVLHL